VRGRVATLLALVSLAGMALADASEGQSGAAASAEAVLVSGVAGEHGAVSATGAGRREDRLEVDEAGISVADGEVVAGEGARASAVARTVSVFGGLVTAYGVRRQVSDGEGGRRYSGRVEGLKLDGRLVGDVRGRRTYTVGGVASVAVNRGGAGLRVRLLRAASGFPAGSTVTIATVRATAAAPEPAPTPTPGPTAAPSPTPTATPSSGRRTAKPRLKRRKAPAVAERLTARRFAFPVYATDASVADDFGAARQIGAHQGNDVFAAFGAPVLAVADGELSKVGTLPISGNRLWLTSDAGDEFFYAHLSAFSPAAVNGRRVKAGQVIGFTGNTGDAEPTPPHVHFEIHPGGGDAIDPHPILLAWQGRRDVAPGAWLTRYGGDTEQRPGALVEVRDFIADG
jgi:murein DD-endopeptidase MepM/ murein hydrolase activator NlpD